MNAAILPKPPIILATPINVEESRAQRLQRQQARFRDRGGIFVPTNRSTLLDILLGKTSPLKKPRRSASASPSRAKEEESSAGDVVSKSALRRSPRKQSQKILDVVTEEQSLVLTDDPMFQAPKPITKAISSKSPKPRPQKKAKVSSKRTTKPRSGASVVDDSVVDTPTEKANKKTVASSEKKPLKVSTKGIIPNVDRDGEDDVPLVKSKPKAKSVKSVSKTKAQAEVGGAMGTSKTRGRKPASATTTAAVTSPTQPGQRKMVESVCSEDDVAYMPTNKAAIKKVTGSQVKLDGAKPRLKPTKKVESVYSEDDSAHISTKKSSTQKVSEDSVACKPTKKSTAKKVKASAASNMGTEQCESSSSWKGKGASNVDETAPCQVPGISEEDEERDSGKEDKVPSKSASNAPKGKKRANTPAAQDSDSQPRRKHIKLSALETDIDPFLHKGLSDEAPLVTSKKRRRNLEGVETGIEDSADKDTIEEDSMKPVAKRSRKTKVTKSARKDKQSSDSGPTASKRKENPRISKPSKKVVSNSGPPKSVLQRIKDSLGTQIVDNEPDPIDFLS